MNSRKIAAGLVVSAALFSGAAWADGSLSGRVGLSGGQYSTKDECPGCGAGFVPTDASVSIYSFLLGGRFSFKRVLFDVGVEGLKYGKDQTLNNNENSYRTDITPSFGVYVGDRWNLFIGYRDALFGDSLFSDTTSSGNGNSETGPFGGVGARFGLGSSMSLSPSLAYNSLKLKFQGSSSSVKNFTLNGYSARLALGFNDTPHSLFLRWQRFDGDFQSGFYKYKEDYVTLGYQATFAKVW